MWSISSTIPRAKLSPQYRVAMFFAALGMILLPLIYLGILGGLGWWLYDLANADVVPVGRRGRSGGEAGGHLVPLFVGGVVLLFMIKPLFSRRPKSVQPRALKPEDEPELFEFINRIAELAGAPKPKRVQVDLQVNASASLTHGFWSLFSRNLTLTIGMPLAGGLSARELGGVLAHEFGHFAQGAGMVTTYVVRVVSMWFARVVYERDRIDELLESWSRNSDFRIMIVLWICRLCIWVGRRALWVLMMVGQLISSVLMRQMEFDADHYEIQASGSEAFISTARRLRVLGVGAQIAHNRMGESFNARRLVDDLPGYMNHEADALAEETITKIREAVAAEKTGWLDSHPSDTQRIGAAERAAAAGVLHSDAKGAALFADFGALSREVTVRFYKEVAGLEISSISLVPLAEVSEESTNEKRGAEAMEKFFCGVLTPRTMVYVLPELIVPGDPELVSRNIAARALEHTSDKERVKELNETFGRFWSVKSILALNAAKISMKNDPELKLKSIKTPDLLLESSDLTSRLAEIECSVAPAIATLRERMVTALGHLLYCADTANVVKTEIRKYVATLRCLSGLDASMGSLRNESIGVGAVLNSLSQASDHNAVHRVVSDGTVAMQPHIRAILNATQEIAYPFPHALGTINMAAYLTSEVSHSDAMIQTYLRGSAIVDRLFSVYSRIMGRLSMLAFEAEAKIDSDRAQPGADEKVAADSAIGHSGDNETMNHTQGNAFLRTPLHGNGGTGAGE